MTPWSMTLRMTFILKIPILDLLLVGAFVFHKHIV